MLKKSVVKALKNLSQEEKDELRKALGYEKPLQNVSEASKDEEGTTIPNESNESEGQNALAAALNGSETEEEDADDGQAGKENSNVDPQSLDSTAPDEVAANPELTDPNASQVAGVESQGNGIRIEDLVTNEVLTERLAALEAKYAAVFDENSALKEKYENPDFGNHAKKGLDSDLKGKKKANESFDDYSKQFM